MGSAVVDKLYRLTDIENIAVCVRNVQKAQEMLPEGIEIRTGDFDDIESLDFTGIDKVYIIPSGAIVPGDTLRAKQFENAIDACIRDNVPYVAITSGPKADTTSFSIAQAYKVAEKRLMESELDYAILRSGWYLENEIASIQGVLAGNPWLTNLGDAKINWILRDEIAEAISHVLVSDEYHRDIFEIAGIPKTQKELVGDLSDVLDREIEFLNVDDEAYSNALIQSGLDEEMVPGIVFMQSEIRSGVLDVSSDDFEKIVGRPPKSLKESLKVIVNQLQ